MYRIRKGFIFFLKRAHEENTSCGASVIKQVLSKQVRENIIPYTHTHTHTHPRKISSNIKTDAEMVINRTQCLNKYL
jgi:N-acetyl-gamma-glutamylphosphate reductase